MNCTCAKYEQGKELYDRALQGRYARDWNVKWDEGMPVWIDAGQEEEEGEEEEKEKKSDRKAQ